jgi:tetratricopeptide (TPR) repeat protein
MAARMTRTHRFLHETPLQVWIQHWAILSVLLASTVLSPSWAATTNRERKSDQSPEAAFFQRTRLDLCAGIPLSEGNTRRLGNLMSQGEPARRQEAALLLARYERTFRGDPVSALKILAPWLDLDKKDVACWAKEVLAEQRRAPNKVQKTEDAPQEATPFPSPDKWTVNGTNTECAVEAIQAQIALKDYQATMTALGLHGPKFDNLSRVLGAEAGGDLTQAMLQYGKAIEFYEFALKSITAMVAPKSEAETKSRTLTPEEVLIQNRIRTRLDEVKRLQDIERYGEGFVLYREAEMFRSQRNYLKAMDIYENIRSRFPKTVYSEAATAYRLKCLLALCLPAEHDKVTQALQQTENVVKRKEHLYSCLKRVNASKEKLDDISREINKAELALVHLKAVPLNAEKILKQTEKEAEEFIAANEFGLYRGEVMLDLADFYLEERLTPDEATKWYRRALTWLERVESADTQLEAFDAPDKAKAVTRPPETTFGTDGWGNVVDNEIRPGQLVNQRTCKWYLDSLRSRCFGPLGFLAFVEGQTDEAKDRFKAMCDADTKVQYLLKKDAPNMYRRLMVRCEDGTLRRASPDELKGFKGRRRFVVFFADFNAEIEKPTKGEKLYRRLLNGDFGKLSLVVEAYVRFGLSWVLWYDGVYSGRADKERAAKEVLEAIWDNPRLQRTATAPRALNALANMLSYGNPEEQKRALRVYRHVVLTFPDTKHGETALYRLGIACLYSKEKMVHREGLESLVKLLQQYPEGQYVELARKKLEADGS